jgi:hypothetical protein
MEPSPLTERWPGDVHYENLMFSSGTVLGQGQDPRR